MDCLLSETPIEWVECVLADFDRFLIDHAACENKAMAQALAILSRYPDEPRIVEPMFAIAKEELEHYQSVYYLMKRRGLTLSTKRCDDYVQSLRRAIRHPDHQHLLDRLLVCALIEARSAERLDLVARHLVDKEYQVFYKKLARIEQGHWKVFYGLADQIYGNDARLRFDELLVIEDQCIRKSPLRAVVH